MCVHTHVCGRVSHAPYPISARASYNGQGRGAQHVEDEDGLDIVELVHHDRRARVEVLKVLTRPPQEPRARHARQRPVIILLDLGRDQTSVLWFVSVHLCG